MTKILLPSRLEAPPQPLQQLQPLQQTQQFQSAQILQPQVRQVAAPHGALLSAGATSAAKPPPVTSEQLLRGGQVVAERPVSREVLVQDGRILEGPPQRLPGKPRPADPADGYGASSLAFTTGAGDAYSRLPAASSLFTEASTFFSQLDPFGSNTQAPQTINAPQPTYSSQMVVPVGGQWNSLEVGDSVPRPDFLKTTE